MTNNGRAYYFWLTTFGMAYYFATRAVDLEPKKLWMAGAGAKNF